MSTHNGLAYRPAPGPGTATTSAARAAPGGPPAGSQRLGPLVDLAELGRMLQRHCQFDLRQLQPAWAENCVERLLRERGLSRQTPVCAWLQGSPEELPRLVERLLAVPACDAGVLRATTRALLDSVLRQRPATQPVLVWVLTSGCDALVQHLRLHLSSLDRDPALLQVRAPQEDASGPGSLVALAPRWLEQQVQQAGGQPAVDVILAPDLFVNWRPDLQRVWITRLAALLQPGGLLLAGRPKALWRAPRGMRAVHLDGLQWLQRHRPDDQSLGDELSDITRPAPAPAEPRRAVAAPAPPALATAPALGSLGTAVIDLATQSWSLNARMAALLGLGAPEAPAGCALQPLLDTLPATERERLHALLASGTTGLSAWESTLHAPTGDTTVRAEVLSGADGRPRWVTLLASGVLQPGG